MKLEDSWDGEAIEHMTSQGCGQGFCWRTYRFFCRGGRSTKEGFLYDLEYFEDRCTSEDWAGGFHRFQSESSL